MSREDTAFNAGLVVGIVATLIFGGMFAWVISGDHLHASHVALGSKGYACFANHTCRENLACLHADGLEPGICVQR